MTTAEANVIQLDYSLTIEGTDDPTFFGFYSPDLEGFTGVGHSVEDCLYQARWAMKEHVQLLQEAGRPVPPRSTDPSVVIRNSHEPAAV
jgi:predicted RNase H-like HicB family nuclease